MSALVTPRAHYASPVHSFLRESDDAVLGALAAASPFNIDITQRDAWRQEIAILRDALQGLGGAALFLEFDVPRVGSRIDAVVLAGTIVFVIEFKVGEHRFLKDDHNQVWDYALDLKNFHKASHSAAIVPILVATEAQSVGAVMHEAAADGVYPPVHCTPSELRNCLHVGLSRATGAPIDAQRWAEAPYHPTPTIIEAAQALYSRHTVQAIAASEAGENLTVTVSHIEDIIERARLQKQKAIVFVTGVPGAGKTLVGLNVATMHRTETERAHAVFLSGNGPLVKVLSHALARDEVKRARSSGHTLRQGKVLQQVKAFIQNVHHFRDDGVNSSGPPVDHVVIFDEAQRAWNLSMTADFMKRRKGRPGFEYSEPAFLISYMDRHLDWAVIICLVGGGQEINRGEGGISEWLAALQASFTHWEVYVSPSLNDSEYDAVEAIDQLKTRATVHERTGLHLSVSMRSFRAEHVSHFVKAVLDRDRADAGATIARLGARYPICVTRDLERAKDWVRMHARGSERYGLVASSGAQRLKPHAVDVRVEIDPVKWFLNEAEDTRSSFYLEDAATEFQVQGLELDWACVTWDADLRVSDDEWSYHSFRGSRWENVHNPDRRAFLKNAYRVLLTRARQGMVIFVPPGSAHDPTRLPEFYDATFDYLTSVGVPTLLS